MSIPFVQSAKISRQGPNSGELELENKDYVKPDFGEKGRKPREERSLRREESCEKKSNLVESDHLI
ncbi:hypothetical protein MTR_8g101870 [Medicago truncatula]|uniref:Uncharacterized protein n=1 Tax=Medicago truncatula TaxID=3880 RepID=G7LJL4_MEDTR|nr:hypothetical protein MTR_8g101870 [Medicago truncatula]